MVMSSFRCTAKDEGKNHCTPATHASILLPTCSCLCGDHPLCVWTVLPSPRTQEGCFMCIEWSDGFVTRLQLEFSKCCHK